MGTSTDGQLCFGVEYDEEFEFPWDHEDHDGDFEIWWQYVNAFENPYQIWNELGTDYLDGVTPEQKRKYYDYDRQWKEDNPYPVELVNYCSGECPMYILAVPDTVITAYRGYPKEVTSDMYMFDTNKFLAFNDFLKKYNLDDRDPAWLLSSYWG